ncbi:MAG: hypothetical protein KBT28_02015 [Bacteroidales bacterium]|nr:hypothetical protein [Candidatus Colimorpha merdihippi]
MQESNENDFAYGRYDRNIFKSLIMNRARLIAKKESPSLQDLIELTEEDIGQLDIS